MKIYVSKIKKKLKAISYSPRFAGLASLKLKRNGSCGETGKLKTENGVSLIEFITATAVFIIVLTIVTGVFFSVFQVSRRSSAVQNVIDEARFILEVMAKEIRTGNTFSQSGGERIQFTSAEGKLINYRQNTTNNTIEKCEVTPPATCMKTDFASITSSQIKIEILSFALLGQLQSDNLQPRITISITFSNKGDKAESITSVTLQTTVSQRQLDS